MWKAITKPIYSMLHRWIAKELALTCWGIVKVEEDTGAVTFIAVEIGPSGLTGQTKSYETLESLHWSLKVRGLQKTDFVRISPPFVFISGKDLPILEFWGTGREQAFSIAKNG